MLIRTDPFRELDRLASQVFGTMARPTAMPMDAWREGDRFIVEFDLPAVDPDSVDVDVERNVLTVRAERRLRADDDIELIAAERPRGVFSRQVILGDALDTDKIEASYQAGVLRLTIPVAEKAKPRKIMISERRPEPAGDLGLTASEQLAVPAAVPSPERPSRSGLAVFGPFQLVGAAPDRVPTGRAQPGWSVRPSQGVGSSAGTSR